jgi:hypothetical protein
MRGLTHIFAGCLRMHMNDIRSKAT